MPKYTDQIGNTILLRTIPKRIVSLVPSQTELLFDLDLNDEVIGITKFCIHPNNWFKYKNRVGGTKNVDLNKIKELNPDLIIANKEENTEEDITKLIEQYPTWTSDIKTLEDVYLMISSIGKMTKTEEKATDLINNISFLFKKLQINTKNIKDKSVLYLIWNNPLMSVNYDTFINEMMSLNNWKNIIRDATYRYPEISEEEIKTLRPEIIFLSSEPFPFKEKHKNEIQNQFPDAKVILVDGEMFSWYGSRLLKAPKYFKNLHQIINLH